MSSTGSNVAPEIKVAFDDTSVDALDGFDFNIALPSNPYGRVMEQNALVRLCIHVRLDGRGADATLLTAAVGKSDPVSVVYTEQLGGNEELELTFSNVMIVSENFGTDADGNTTIQYHGISTEIEDGMSKYVSSKEII